MTFEIAMGLSFSAIPPLICLAGLGRVWRLIIDTPSTNTVPRLRSTEITRPLLPLSRPVITFTWSFFLTLILSRSLVALPALRTNLVLKLIFAIVHSVTLLSDHFGSQRNNLHKLLVAKLAGHRAEHARTHRLADFIDQHGGIGVETHVGAILAPQFLAHTDDYAADHFPLLNGRFGSGFLDTRRDDVAQTRAQS